MTRSRPGRASRVAPDALIHDAFGRPDYASAFSVALAGPSPPPESRARAVFEGAPTPLRLFVVFGWRAVLRLRLGPPGSADHVLGWQIVQRSPQSITLHAGSPLMQAQKVIRADDASLVAATYVWFRSRLGRVVWSGVAPVHHLTEPLLLNAARIALTQDRQKR